MFETYNNQNDTKDKISSSIDKQRGALLASKLRLFRQQCNMTQEYVAYKLVCPQSTISKLERGERELKAIELFDIAKIYGKDVDEFFV